MDLTLSQKIKLNFLNDENRRRALFFIGFFFLNLESFKRGLGAIFMTDIRLTVILKKW
jgi:hypothetical protein